MKRKNKTSISIVAVAISLLLAMTCLVGCGIKPAVFDDNGNLLYNGDVYVCYKEPGVSGGIWLLSTHGRWKTVAISDMLMPFQMYAHDKDRAVIYSYAGGATLYVKQGYPFPTVHNSTIQFAKITLEEQLEQITLIDLLWGKDKVSTKLNNVDSFSQIVATQVAEVQLDASLGDVEIYATNGLVFPFSLYQVSDGYVINDLGNGNVYLLNQAVQQQINDLIATKTHY